MSSRTQGSSGRDLLTPRYPNGAGGAPVRGGGVSVIVAKVDRLSRSMLDFTTLDGSLGS